MLQSKGSDGQKDVTSLCHHWELSAAVKFLTMCRAADKLKHGISSYISFTLHLSLPSVLFYMSDVSTSRLHIQYETTPQ